MKYYFNVRGVVDPFEECFERHCTAIFNNLCNLKWQTSRYDTMLQHNVLVAIFGNGDKSFIVTA